MVKLMKNGKHMAKKLLGLITAFALCLTTFSSSGLAYAASEDDDDASKDAYTVTLMETENGSVVFHNEEDNEVTDKQFVEGDEVVLDIEPDESYEFQKIEILSVDDEIIAEDETEGSEQYTFMMPTADLQIQVTFKANAEDVVTEEAKNDDYGIQTLADTEDDVWISGFTTLSQTDGTSPWDDDDTAGNDSNNSNLIVRSFDYINYTLEYTTAIPDDATTPVDEGYVCVEFELDCDVKIAKFDFEAMTWCEDLTVTYYYDDATESTGYDSSKTVIKQVLTGKRHISNSGNVAIPGKGTLSVNIYVTAAPNGTKITPSFKVWMEGNDENLAQTADNVQTETVSAAPKYNIEVKYSGGTNVIGYYNFDEGSWSSGNSNDGEYGRVLGYSVTLQLYNDSASKGMKGIEYPQGSISFDLTLNSMVNGDDSTFTDDYKVTLWDYTENPNSSGSISLIGHVGRQMVLNGSYSTAYYGPGNNTGNNSVGENRCYNGGNWSITEDGNVMHVTVSDYAFDYDTYSFPQRYIWSNTGTTHYAANVGCFSCGFVEVFSRFPESVDTTSTVYQKVAASNLNVASVSGQTGHDVYVNDDTVNTELTLYPKGSFTQYQRYVSTAGNANSYLSSTYSAGDNVTYKGTDLYIYSFVYGSSEINRTAFNVLQKFDDKILEITKDQEYTVSPSSSITSASGTTTMLYAAKPDKTGWIDDDEMMNTTEEELVYFESISNLESAGYICVGVLWETRDCIADAVSSSSTWFGYYLPVHVQDDVEVGSVAQTVCDARCWNEGNEQAFVWRDYPYSEQTGAYGLGRIGYKASSSGYVDGYTTPSARQYDTSYGKAYYVDGVMYGHTGGYQQGNSLLIIGYKAQIELTVDDKASGGGGEAKSVYDLDAGERTVTYRVTPSTVIDSNNENAHAKMDYYTNLQITITLPDGLTYDTGSASITPSEVIENDDGTTTIIFDLENVKVEDMLDDITFTCTIGHEGTAEDVVNGQSLEVSAAISGDDDERAYTATNNNLSETSISVIRLVSLAISKQVDSTLVELGEEIGYKMYVGNDAEESVSDVQIYDVLPYANDGRDTNYSGSYTVKSISINFSEALETEEIVRSTMTAETTTDALLHSNSEAESILMDGTKAVNWSALSGGSWDGDTVTYTVNKEATAFKIDLFTLQGKNYLTIHVSLIPDDNAKAGDVYGNSFYEYDYGSPTIVSSNIAEISIASRSVSGLTWLDKNMNGIQDEGEELLSGVEVSLRKDTYKNALFDKIQTFFTGDAATDVYGNTIEPVTTGSDGKYEFDNLAAGNYIIEFDVDSKALELTLQDQGDDDTKDSDAYLIANSGGTLTAGINVAMPSIDSMVEDGISLYNLPNEDAGFYYLQGDVKIVKTMDPADATKWDSWTFTLYGTSDSGEQVNMTLGLNGEGEATFKDVPMGTYTISESGESSYWDLYVGEVTVVPGDTVTIEIENTATTGNTKVTKTIIDPSGLYDGDLSGFEFTLTGTADIGSEVNMTAATDSNGTVTFEVYPGSYTLTEVGSPDASGYGSWWDNDGPWTVDVAYNRTTNITATNIYKTGNITVTKSMDPSNANKNDTWTFRLYGTSDSGVGVDEAKTFDGEGSVTFSDIPVGTYTLDETYDDGLWASNKASQIVTVDYNTTTQIEVTNTAVTGTAAVKKVVTDPSGLYTDGLEGFTFELSGTSDIGIAVDRTGTTDASGNLTFDDVYTGTYTLTETGVPDWWDTQKTWTVTVESGKTTTVEAENIYKTGNITLTKATEPGDETQNNTWTFTLNGTSDSGVAVHMEKSFSGSGTAEFNNVPIGTYTLIETFDSDLWESSAVTQEVTIGYKGNTAINVTNTATEGIAAVQKVITDPSGLYANGLGGFTFTLKGTSEIGLGIDMTATTNEDGVVEFLNVYPGTYTLTEIATEGADGILDWWDTVSTWTATVTKDNTTTIEAENIFKTGDIAVQKEIVKYEESGKSLAGFAFHLTGTCDDGEEIDWYAVTDDSGLATFKDVPIGAGYTVTEVSKEDVQAAADQGNASAAAILDDVRDDMDEFFEVDSQNVDVSYKNTSALTFINEVEPDIHVTKVADHKKYNVGDPIVYTIEITETIPGGTARDIEVVDEMPAGLTIIEDPVLTGIEGTVELHASNGTYTVTATIPELAYTDKATITYTATSDGSLAGTLPDNQVRVNDIYLDHDEDDEEVEILKPELAISKVADQDLYSVGDTVTYAIAVNQTVDEAVAHNVVVTDSVPTNLKLESVENEYGDVTIDGNSFIAKLGDMEYNEIKTIMVTATVLEESDAIVNTAYANADYSDEVHNDETIRTVKPVLSIMKEADDTSYALLDEVVYTITVNQTKEDAVAHNVVVSDTVPDELELIDVTAENGEVEIDGNAFTVAFGDMAFNEPQTIVVTAKAIELGENIVNTAMSDADNADPVDDDWKITVRKPELSIKKEADAEFYDPGDEVTYTITIRNEKEDLTACNVVLRDTLPDELTLVSAEVTDGREGTVEYDDANGFIVSYEIMKYGEESVVTVKATIDDALSVADIDNIAYVSADNVDEIDDYAEIHVRKPVLEVEKQVGKEVYAVGDEVTYTIDVKQTVENAVAKNVVITDTLPDKMTLIDAVFADEDVEGEIEVDGNTFTAKVESLAFGETVPIVVTATANAEGSGVTNTAYADADNAEQTEDEAVIDIRKPILSVSKTSDKQSYNVNDTVIYTIHVEPTVKDVTARNVIISDVVPEELEVQNVENSTGTVNGSGNSITVECGDMDYGDSVTVTVAAKAVTAGTGINNTATATADNSDAVDDSAVIDIIVPAETPTSTSTPETTTTTPTETVEPKDDTVYSDGAKTGVYAGIAIALVLLAAGGAYIVYYRRKKRI